MRVFNAFLVILTAAILLAVPVTAAIYDFRTDLREDTFVVATGVGITSANVTLFDALFDSDIHTVTVSSNVTGDAPVASSYNATDQHLLVSGLAASDTRILSVEYDYDALKASGAIATLISRWGYLVWWLCLLAFAPAAIAAIFMGRA